MSETTALALATLPETSALALARTGNLLPEGVTEASVAPVEQDDFSGIEFRPKIIQANGQEGQFKDRDLAKDIAGPNEVFGVAVVANQTQNLFRPNKQKLGQYAIYNMGKELAEGTHKYICACSDKLRGTPRLNPALTADQVEAAKKAGIGGATGVNCAACPMATKDWRLDEAGQKVPPPCTPGAALAWLDSQQSEPAVLRMLGESARNFFAVVARRLKLGKGSLWPFSFALRFKFVKRTNVREGSSYWSADTIIGDKIPESEYPKFLDCRRNLMGMVREVTEADDEHLDTLAEQEEAAAYSGPGRTVDHQADTGSGGIQFGPDGLPYFPDEDQPPVDMGPVPL